MVFLSNVLDNEGELRIEKIIYQKNKKKKSCISYIIVFISIFYILGIYIVIPDVLCEVKVAAAECVNNE